MVHRQSRIRAPSLWRYHEGNFWKRAGVGLWPINMPGHMVQDVDIISHHVCVSMKDTYLEERRRFRTTGKWYTRKEYAETEDRYHLPRGTQWDEAQSYTDYCKEWFWQNLSFHDKRDKTKDEESWYRC